MFLVSSWSCLCPIHWSQVLSWEWRCSWSNTDRWCSNIWMINIFIAQYGATYIRGFTVSIFVRNPGVLNQPAKSACVWFICHCDIHDTAATMPAHFAEIDSLFDSRKKELSWYQLCFRSVVAPHIVIMKPVQQSWHHDNPYFSMLTVTEGFAMLYTEPSNN